MPGSFGDEQPPATYEVRAPTQPDPSKYVYPPRANSYGSRQDSYGSRTDSYGSRQNSQGSRQNSMSTRYAAPPSAVPYPPEEHAFPPARYNEYSPHERTPQPPSGGQEYYRPPPGPPPPRRESGLAYGEDGYRSPPRRDSEHPYGEDPHRPREPHRQSSYSTPGYKYTPNAPAAEPGNSSYQYQYAQPPERLTYVAKPQAPQQPASYSAAPQNQFPEQLPRAYAHNAYDRDGHVDTSPDRDSHDRRRSAATQSQRQHSYTENARVRSPPSPEEPHRSYSHDAYEQDAHVVEMKPNREKLERTTSASRTTTQRQTSYSESSSLSAPGLAPRMNRLSVSGNRPDVHGAGGVGGLPPPSPLLEAYHGTYQSISPMPLAIRPDDDDELSDLEPLSSPVSKRHGSKELTESEVAREKEKKRVKLYDGEEDAKGIAAALNRHKVDADAICETLPPLSHDQIMEVRKEYKKQVKVQGKGVNLPKHIKTKLTGNFGKAVYVTALGRWESEGYWANFFYQSHGSRRELLIESLMGRTNAEVRMIKDEFKDKRYSDSLTKCMEKELKMDKFRVAILMVLEERRQEEQDHYPAEYIHKDVDMLYRAVRAEKGGESTMLEIIVRRSDSHLRDVLRYYERTHGENFARAALKKSNNLVVSLHFFLLFLRSICGGRTRC